MAADAVTWAFLYFICSTNKSIAKSLDDLGEGEAQIWLRPENPPGVRSVPVLGEPKWAKRFNRPPETLKTKSIPVCFVE